MDGIKGLLTSKKFYITVLGAATVAALDQFGVDQHIILAIAGLFGINVAAQGIADTKK